MTRDPKRLLGGYATDTLTEEERRELLRAALDDQELFDALVEEDGLRELLEAPGARQQVLAALETPTAWDRVRGWLKRPATFGDLAAVAAVFLAAFVGYQVLFPGAPEPSPGAAATPLVAQAVSPAVRARLLGLPENEVVPAALGVASRDRAAPVPVRPGEELELEVRLAPPARVLVVATRPDGSSAQVFPGSGSPPALVERQPGAGPVVWTVPLRAPDRPGAARVRLVVAPVDVDLGAATPEEVERLAPRLTLVDLTLEVTAP